MRNAYIEQYAASNAPTLSGYVQNSANGDIVRAALDREDRDYYPLWAGQGVGMVKEVLPAAAVLQALVRDAEATLGALARVPR